MLKKLFFRYAFHQDFTPRPPDRRFQSDRCQQRKRQRRRKSQSSGQLRQDRDQGNDESGNDSQGRHVARRTGKSVRRAGTTTILQTLSHELSLKSTR